MQKFLTFMVTWGIWDILAIIISIFPAILVFIYLLPKKQIKNLYVDAKFHNNPQQTYSKIILFEIRNHTNIPIYIVSEGFNFGNKVKPNTSGAKNINTNTYEIKFEGRADGLLTEIDTLIRPNQAAQTWVPVDTSETEANCTQALNSKSVGILKLRALKIDKGRDNFVSLSIKV